MQLTLTSTQGAECRDVDGVLACYAGVDSVAPVATVTAKLQNNLIWGRPFWYLQGDFSIADAHEDNRRDGFLNLFFDSEDGRQSVDVYLVSAP